HRDYPPEGVDGNHRFSRNGLREVGLPDSSGKRARLRALLDPKQAQATPQTIRIQTAQSSSRKKKAGIRNILKNSRYRDSSISSPHATLTTSDSQVSVPRGGLSLWRRPSRHGLRHPSSRDESRGCSRLIDPLQNRRETADAAPPPRPAYVDK